MIPITYRCAIPNIEIFDYTGDGIEDLFVINRQEISIYAGTLRGEFSPEPVARPGDELWPETSDDEEFNIQVRDLNGDGLADLVISQYTGGLMNVESAIKIFLCKTRGGYNQIPSFTCNLSKSVGFAYLHDLNSDGRIDIIIPGLKIGIMALMKMLILNRLDIGLDIYLQGSGGKYPDEPSLSRSMRASVDLGSTTISLGENIAVGGDFNGDNLCDFLIETGDGELDVYFGTVGTVLENAPGWTYKLPKPSSILAADCDNDGVSEIFAFYGDAAAADRDKIKVVHVALDD